jgi:hypothetical protein
MTTKILYISAAVLAVALGVSASTWVFVNSSYALIPWAIAGIIIGLFAKERKAALWAGGIYGFILPVAFMISGYNGPHELNRYEGLIILCLILGVIGIMCGAILAYLGNLFVRKQKNETSA